MFSGPASVLISIFLFMSERGMETPSTSTASRSHNNTSHTHPRGGHSSAFTARKAFTGRFACSDLFPSSVFPLWVFSSKQEEHAAMRPQSSAWTETAETYSIPLSGIGFISLFLSPPSASSGFLWRYPISCFLSDRPIRHHTLTPTTFLGFCFSCLEDKVTTLSRLDTIFSRHRTSERRRMTRQHKGTTRLDAASHSLF